MTYTKSQITALVLLRVVIGWHFLFEGASKLMNPNWSSKAYLLDSHGLFSGIFQKIANSESLLATADVMNGWGLTLIGLGLVVGLFTRISAISGVILLGLYYLSHPACLGYEYLFPSEGSYFIVNKNVVEIFALLVLIFFPSGRYIGLDRFLTKKN